MSKSSAGVRFWKYFEADQRGCWLWRRHIGLQGYGMFTPDGKTVYAHRWAYEYLRGPIPDGLQIDHLCRVRHCVNPGHMEVVTSRENVRRGIGPTAQKMRQTHCLRGHLLAAPNLYRCGGQGRRCKICHNMRQEHYDSRKVEQK